MKVRFLKNLNSTRGIFTVGTVIEVEDELARKWISQGFASPVVSYKPKAERAVIEPPEKRGVAGPVVPPSSVKPPKKGRKKKGNKK
jgi:hypothetical protein